MHTVRGRPLISKPMTTTREMGVTAEAATEEGATEQGATEQGATAERTTEKGVKAESVTEEGATELGATEEDVSWHITAQHAAPTARHARPTNSTSSTPRTLHPPRYSTLAARHRLPSTGILAASRPKNTNPPLLSAATVPRRCPRPAPITPAKGWARPKACHASRGHSYRPARSATHEEMGRPGAASTAGAGVAASPRGSLPRERDSSRTEARARVRQQYEATSECTQTPPPLHPGHLPILPDPRAPAPPRSPLNSAPGSRPVAGAAQG